MFAEVRGPLCSEAAGLETGGSLFREVINIIMSNGHKDPLPVNRQTDTTKK